MTAIRTNNVSVKQDGNIILDDINISIPEKEFLGIIGPNGGGKTTLLKVFLGLIKPDSGEVIIYDKKPEENLHLIGYVPQFSSFDIEYPISVWDVVMMGRLGRKGLLKKFNEEDYKIVENSLIRVNIIEFKNRLISNLSGGEKQRVMIARALTTSPKILLLDEPTASIDTTSGKNFYDLLNKLNEDVTIVLVSHDIGAISNRVKKIACLNKKLVYHNSKEITKEMLEQTYGCPVDLIAHGVPHRVFEKHG